MDVKKHYKDLFAKYGNSAEAVQWTDLESQAKRFQILSEIDKSIHSVVDVGCGLASLYDFLKIRNSEIKYLGLDFVDEFVLNCSEKFKNNPLANFFNFDLSLDPIPLGYDYIFSSGIFNNKFDNNLDFFLNGITKMFNACNKGIAFNAMSTYVDFRVDNLYYSNPLEIFDYCKKKLSSKVVLRHDYLVKSNSIPFEYCIYVYR